MAKDTRPKCKYCGVRTETRVWTQGTRKRFIPICVGERCWKKYWKENEGR